MSSKSEPGWSSAASSSALEEAAASACSWRSRVSATFCFSFSLSAFFSFLSFFLWTPSVLLCFFSFFSFLSFLDLILTSSSDDMVTINGGPVLRPRERVWVRREMAMRGRGGGWLLLLLLLLGPEGTKMRCLYWSRRELGGRKCSRLAVLCSQLAPLSIGMGCRLGRTCMLEIFTRARQEATGIMHLAPESCSSADLQTLLGTKPSPSPHLNKYIFNTTPATSFSIVVAPT